MTANFTELTVKAPAKINLHLEVKNRRPDGFHDIESVFLKVDFCDTLHFRLLETENSVQIETEGLNFPLPVEKNIIFKALFLFREKTGFSKGLSVKVEKRIPLGGGLGGGSSDAAAALLALNKLAGSPLDRAVLLEIAAALGSDVPFFLHETAAAVVTGRGENIRPIKAPRLFLVLVNPGFPSDTAAAYRLLDERRNLEDLARRHGGTAPEEAPRSGVDELNSTAWRTTKVNKMNDCARDLSRAVRPEENELSDDISKWKFFNDFLDVFEGREKAVYEEIILKLHGLGAVFAGLSGTGAVCFGVFLKRESAEKAAEVLRGMWEFAEVCGVIGSCII